MMISNVRGSSPTITGVLTLDDKDCDEVDGRGDDRVASIKTRDAQRDGHLKSADFFDVEKFPTMTFKSTRGARGRRRMAVEGELTIHGVTAGGL